MGNFTSKQQAIAIGAAAVVAVAAIAHHHVGFWFNETKHEATL